MPTGVYVRQPWHRAKLSAALKGRTTYERTPEIRAKIRSTLTRTRDEAITRLIANIAVMDYAPFCWIWKGRRDKAGYGKFIWRGVALAHQVSYMLFRGDGTIPMDPTWPGRRMNLDHALCQNGPSGCCNPWHLEPVTHAENVRRANVFTNPSRAAKMIGNQSRKQKAA